MKSGKWKSRNGRAVRVDIGRSQRDDELMLRVMVVATLALGLAAPTFGQELSVIHIKIVLTDAGQRATPVARHALLISDNPATSSPRRVVTTVDGTADVKVRPGNYTVESDSPVVFQGKAYQWTQIVDIKAGRDTVLELTSSNAEVVSGAPATDESAVVKEGDPSFLLTQWQDSIVALWTPYARVSGFVIDARGLIATNQRMMGSATSVEVQLSPTAKVAASILVANPERDVAVLWIGPASIASVRPVPLGCTQDAPHVVEGQKLFAIGSPLGQQKDISSGTARAVDARVTVSDFGLGLGAEGGPAFSAAGELVGLTSAEDPTDDGSRRTVRVVGTAALCDAVASAEKKMANAVLPTGTPLPVEPASPFPVDVLKEAASRRAGSLNPYQITSSAFDVSFITPVMIYGKQYQSDLLKKRSQREGSRIVDVEGPRQRTLEFGNWSEYVSALLPVLLVRVTPKLVESFWTTVARGAAQTQGVSLPPIKHVTSGFSRMHAYCDEAEVTPIHPFKIEQRISERDVVDEGLYVFDPGAFGPQCATVKFVLYSTKAPEKGDSRVIDPRVIQQIWQDFAPYRELGR